MSRPATGTPCEPCNRNHNHFCQAQIMATDFDEGGNEKQSPMCLDCADDKPCSVQRVGSQTRTESFAATAPIDEGPQFSIPKEDMLAYQAGLVQNHGIDLNAKPKRKSGDTQIRYSQEIRNRVMSFPENSSVTWIAEQCGISRQAVYGIRAQEKRKQRLAQHAATTVNVAPPAPKPAPTEKTRGGKIARYGDDVRDRVMNAFPTNTSAKFISEKLGIPIGSVYSIRAQESKKKPAALARPKAKSTAIVAQPAAAAPGPHPEPQFGIITLHLSRPQMDNLWSRLTVDQAASLMQAALPKMLGVAQ